MTKRGGEEYFFPQNPIDELKLRMMTLKISYWDNYKIVFLRQRGARGIFFQEFF